jgi:hypothetical protein
MCCDSLKQVDRGLRPFPYGLDEGETLLKARILDHANLLKVLE